MIKMHRVGKVLHGLTVEQLSAVFAQGAQWAGATTDDRISEKTLANMVAIHKAHGLKTSEISYDGEVSTAEVHNWGNDACPADFFTLGEEKSVKKTGLPMEVQNVLAQDLKDFHALTGHCATTRIYVGDRLETDWNYVTHRSRQTPLMVRDLSGHGWYYAEAADDKGFEIECEEGQGATMVNLDSLATAFNEGSLIQHQIAPGGRLFCNAGLLAREYWVGRELKPMVNQIRAYTAVYNF